MKSFVWLVVGLSITFLLPTSVFSEEFTKEFGWKLKKKKNGIEIHTRKVEDWATREFQGVTTVKTSLVSAISLFEDTKRISEWMYRVKEFKELKEISSSEKIFYFRQGIQWPISDRDGVYTRSRIQDPVTNAVSYTSVVVPNGYPLQKDAVRMPYIRSLFLFTPKEDGTLVIYYRLLLDMGGKIPKWLVNNKLNVDIPFYTLKKFKKILEESQYQNATESRGLTN